MIKEFKDLAPTIIFYITFVVVVFFLWVALSP